MKKKSRKSASSAWRTLHYYWQAIKRYPALALGVVLSTPVVLFLRNFLIVYLLTQIIERVSSGELSADQLWPQLLPVAAVIVATHFFNSVVLEKVRLFCCWRLELKVMYDLAGKCFDALANQSMQFHNNRFGGSLVSQTSKFIYGLERLVDELVWNSMFIFFSIIFTMVILWGRAPWFVAGLSIFVAIYIAIAFIAFKKTAHLNEKESSAQTKQTGKLADSLTNILAVKSYGRELYEKNRYKEVNREVYATSNNLMRAMIIRDIVFSVVYVGITFLLSIFLIGGQSWFGFSVATLILIVTYSQQLMGNLWEINITFRNFNRVFGDAKEMTEILDAAQTVFDMPGAKPIEISKGKVDFNKIHFSHADAPDLDNVFKDFSLHIKPGQRIGLVGRSGSGKTTLTKLLLRFADVNQGEILIDGQNISQVTQVSLRENIAYVPQETTLFHRTIRENIAYGKPDASDDEIERAARLANALEFIEKLPHGFETLTGERGVKLSGGQRQRIAIARAILKDAPILVLDEATSALDSESEKLIQDALQKLMRGRTCLVIAHRLSTVANLDRIIVLEEGKIVGDGSHAQLVKGGGEYAKLWSRQSGAFLK